MTVSQDEREQDNALADVSWHQYPTVSFKVAQLYLSSVANQKDLRLATEVFNCKHCCSKS